MDEFWTQVFISAVCFAPGGIGIYFLGYYEGKRKAGR